MPVKAFRAGNIYLNDRRKPRREMRLEIMRHTLRHLLTGFKPRLLGRRRLLLREPLSDRQLQHRAGLARRLDIFLREHLRYIADVFLVLFRHRL
jgi:hypothetical protein